MHEYILPGIGIAEIVSGVRCDITFFVRKIGGSCSE